MSKPDGWIHEKLIRDVALTFRMWRIAWFLGKQDVKARFRRSHVGPLWILLNLAVWVGGVGLVYGYMLGQNVATFLPQLMAGFVVWGFISGTLLDSTLAYINAEGYIKQFAFPKQIHILRAFFANSITFFIGFFALLLVIGFLVGWRPASVLLAVPGIFLLLFAGLGHGFIFSYVGTRYRDISHAMGGALQVIFLVTPIVFPASMLGEKGLAWIYELNPFYYLVDIVRHPLLRADWAASASYLGALGYSFIVWLIAYFVARHMDRKVVFLL